MIAALTASQSKDVWYLMRGTGLMSLVLLTFTLAAGIAGVRRWSTTGWPRATVAFLHRNLALLAVCLLAIHITTAVIDPYVSIGWLAAVVPLASHWQSVWVGLGALALDSILALVVTSLVRSHLSHRLWRTVHWLAYATWPLAVVHGFESGTDSTTGWARAVYITSILIVAAAVIWRVRRRPVGAPGADGTWAVVEPGSDGPVGQPLVGQPLVGQPLVGQPLVGQPLVGQPRLDQPRLDQPRLSRDRYAGAAEAGS